jgi:hypothetical protein
MSAMAQAPGGAPAKLSRDPIAAESAFVPPALDPAPDNRVQVVRALVLNFEPTVPSEGNRTLWDIFGWNDPRQLAEGFVEDMEAASGGAVDYQIVQWRDLNEFPIFTDGFRYTPDQYVQNRRSNSGWATTAADFYAIARQQGLAELVNQRAIDEIWMFGDHYFALLGEAWMAGPGSFFINGPVFPDFAVDHAVAGYGFNYERGVAEMLHNHGHRTENHMARAYGGWNIANPVSPWDYFTANAGQTNRETFGVGSDHYPFNAAADYDYANERTFPSYADDFVVNFPNQMYTAVPMSRDAWGDRGTGDWHRAYFEWFFGHVPRAAGQAPDGRQNNWYKYINDFNAYRPVSGLARDNEAILGAAPLQANGGESYEFTLRFYDVQGIDARSLGDTNLLVTGPNGFSQLATIADVGAIETTTAGTAQTVRYRISAPGGIWDAADVGFYSVTLRANEVRDSSGTFLPAANLGQFNVTAEGNGQVDTQSPQATVKSTPVVAGNERSSSFTIRYTDDRSIDVSTINFGDIRVTGPNGFVQTSALYALDANANGPMRDVVYFVSAPGGAWDAGDNGAYAIELLSDQVFDTSGKPIAAILLGSFTVELPGPQIRPPADMTELNAEDWLARADGATATTSHDLQRTVSGASSIRFDTTGGFDTYLRYEPSVGAVWELTGARRFRFRVYAENPSPVGFQAEPLVRWVDADGDAVEFRYWRNGAPNPLWNDARDQWMTVDIALHPTNQPATGWRVTEVGTPDWSLMQSVEIHADTWDFGFTLWFDDMHVVMASAGDSNLDGKFDSTDLVHVFQAGKYEDAVSGNATWAEGDWDGDREFTTSDLVFAFQAGTYVAAATKAMRSIFPIEDFGLVPVATARTSQDREQEDDARGEVALFGASSSFSPTAKLWGRRWPKAG